MCPCQPAFWRSERRGLESANLAQKSCLGDRSFTIGVYDHEILSVGMRSYVSVRRPLPHFPLAQLTSELTALYFAVFLDSAVISVAIPSTLSRFGFENLHHRCFSQCRWAWALGLEVKATHVPKTPDYKRYQRT